MPSVITIVALIPLLFWIWMFLEMARNDDIPAVPGFTIHWPLETKFDWTVAFVFLNILTALYYFFTEYLPKD